MGAVGTPTGAPKVLKGGAVGATPPEGEGNPAEGGYFASSNLTVDQFLCYLEFLANTICMSFVGHNLDKHYSSYDHQDR